ncbi:MAG: UTP--glucose-1-phosphate uridylyltransferase GalU [Rickettsiales bacterium]|nr:UTP--glucose-1-phosphate uridylyltransferase GalU [Rickettsiales bacterium]
MQRKKIKKVVFPVGGLGTRFLPVTKTLPKEMLPVANKPLIQYAFEEAKEAGIEEFIFITGRNKNVINNHFDHVYELQQLLSDKQKKRELELTKNWLPDAGSIMFIRQQNPLGLGHAIWCARKAVGDEPFAVILADELLKTPKGFLKEMLGLYNEVGGNILGLAEVPREEVSSYGIVDVTPNGHYYKINNMVEKPSVKEAPSSLIIAGRYILNSSIFDVLEHTKEGRGGEIQLTDAMVRMLGSEKFYGKLFGGARFDCGNYLGYLEANLAYACDETEYHSKIQGMLKKYGV